MDGRLLAGLGVPVSIYRVVRVDYRMPMEESEP